MTKTFQLGQLAVTRNAMAALNPLDVLMGLTRHVRCDWGDVCQEDKETNEAALSSNSRILSAYHSKDGTEFWIITEADRSATTVLLPADY